MSGKTFAAATNADAMERALDDAFTVVFGTFGRAKAAIVARDQSTKTPETRLDEVIQSTRVGTRARETLELLREGLSPRQVADKFGIKIQDVYSTIYAKGLRLGALK